MPTALLTLVNPSFLLKTQALFSLLLTYRVQRALPMATTSSGGLPLPIPRHPIVVESFRVTASPTLLKRLRIAICSMFCAEKATGMLSFLRGLNGKLGNLLSMLIGGFGVSMIHPNHLSVKIGIRLIDNNKSSKCTNKKPRCVCFVSYHRWNS